MKHLLRIFICLTCFGVSLYLYLDKINEQTNIRFKIPQIEKEIEELEQANIELAYQIENFKNPQHLLELAERPEYSHLKFPFAQEVMVISTEIAKRFEKSPEDDTQKSRKAQWPIFLGSSN